MGGGGQGGLAYRPLTTLTYALNHAVGGLAPFGYHLVNLLLHAGASVLVLALATSLGLPLAAATLRRTPVRGAPRPRGGGGERRRAQGAARHGPGARGRAPPRGRAAAGRVEARRRPTRGDGGGVHEGDRARRHRARGRARPARRPRGAAGRAAPRRGAVRVVPGRRRSVPRRALEGPREPRHAGHALPREPDRLRARARARGDRARRPRQGTPAPRRSRHAVAGLLVRGDSAGDDGARSRGSPAAVAGLAVAVALAAWPGEHRRLRLTALAWYGLTIFPGSNLLVPIGTLFGERLLYLPSVGFALVVAALVARWLQGPRRSAALAVAGARALPARGPGRLVRARVGRRLLHLLRGRPGAARFRPDAAHLRRPAARAG